LYGEYSLLAAMDEPILEIDLGIGNSSQIGLVIYLPWGNDPAELLSEER
jgi:hypothetical protein